MICLDVFGFITYDNNSKNSLKIEKEHSLVLRYHSYWTVIIVIWSFNEFFFLNIPYETRKIVIWSKNFGFYFNMRLCEQSRK